MHTSVDFHRITSSEKLEIWGHILIALGGFMVTTATIIRSLRESEGQRSKFTTEPQDLADIFNRSGIESPFS